MRKVNREYNFVEENYCFKINKSMLDKYELDDIEEFIIDNEMISVEEIKVRLQQKFDINNSGSYFIIWDKLHKLYTEDVINWINNNPFEDMYEYSGENYKFEIDVSLNKDYDKYKVGIFNALAKKCDEYEENINKMSENPLTNLIFVSVSSNKKVVGRITFLLGTNKSHYVIGNIKLDKNIDENILNNVFLWCGSRLCLIFGYICNSFEFRINVEDKDKCEIRKLCSCGFKCESFETDGRSLILLKKNI